MPCCQKVYQKTCTYSGHEVSSAAETASLMEAILEAQERAEARQLLCRTWSSFCCPLLARGFWCCSPCPSPGLRCRTVLPDFRYHSVSCWYPQQVRIRFSMYINQACWDCVLASHSSCCAGTLVSCCFPEACPSLHPEPLRECGAVPGSRSCGVYSKDHVGAHGAQMAQAAHQPHALSLL